MLKHFSFTNQQGFFFPYVLFVISLTFIIVSANIKIYHNEIYLSEHMIEQIKVDTLIQMSTMKFKKQVDNMEELPREVIYVFPPGEVKLFYVSHDDTFIKIRYDIQTDKNKFFSIINNIKWPASEEKIDQLVSFEQTMSKRYV